MDLRIFAFDYDVTWMGFFLNHQQQILGRYGGRNAKSADAFLSLTGLKYALDQALLRHKAMPIAKPPLPGGKPFTVRDLSAAKKLPAMQCIHCHQVWEFQRAAKQAEKKWSPEDTWVYPLPENIGLTMTGDQGDLIKRVEPNSPAAKVLLQPGDVLEKVNEVVISSIADLQFALHTSRSGGKLNVQWKRKGRSHKATLDLKHGWKHTNPTWRPSMLSLLPAIELYGDDLTAREKKVLGLGPNRLAFREEKKPPRSLQKAGIRGGDIIIGVDGKALEMDVFEFLGYLRKHYLIGDTLELNLIRDGKRMNLKLPLK